ncbi:flagellar hook assembly protein FlgD [Thermocrinis minervae]|uniref:Flagellar basal-body rod modification protein FlgD n=1 Tax=Thermocrinis minervae TaxID=381751 RepID=A0A1M6S9E1_9AQUI|nr:flagellar hook capping FlgD N-terminal domain-containing protein [Thermocrinis minervae]SHK41325.1 flagellar basal-body rod modification protein FlgD [Thermocrinis minervae]
MNETQSVAQSTPKILPQDYTPGIDNLSSDDFLKIYLETLKYQDPFQEQDFSKMLDDMVKLNQVKYMNYTENFFNKLTTLLNQFTFLQSLSLIGKSFIFSADSLNPTTGLDYYLVSPQAVSNARVDFVDNAGNVVKSVQMNLDQGPNRLDISGLPYGDYAVKVYVNGQEVDSVKLGYLAKVVSLSLQNNSPILELSNGSYVDPYKIVYAGGV